MRIWVTPTMRSEEKDHRSEFDEVFVREASVHIERMADRCFWIGIDPPSSSRLPSLRIFTGVERGKWFFRISEDSLDAAQEMVVQRPAKYEKAKP